MMQDRDEKNLEEIRKEFDEKERLGENKIQESEVREESEIEGMKDAQEVSDEKPNASVEESEIDESEVLKNEIRALKEENARLRAEFINYRNAVEVPLREGCPHD